MAKNIDDEITYGTDNVFADLGLPDPETHILKASLVLKIHKLIKERNFQISKDVCRP